jgi:hypothetical protein
MQNVIFVLHWMLKIITAPAGQTFAIFLLIDEICLERGFQE